MNFNEVTKRERLVKSIKLEAVPTEATRRAIKEQQLFEKDNAITERADRLKPLVDEYIKAVLENALAHIAFDFDTIYKAYTEKGDDSKKELKALTNQLTDAAAKVIRKNMLYGVKNPAAMCSANFVSKVLPLVLDASDRTDSEKAYLHNEIEEFSGCYIKMERFIRTRVTTLETWAPERVAENFMIYAANIKNIEVFLKADDDVLNRFELLEELKTITIPSYYELCCSPSGIDAYNRIISGVISENGTEIMGYNAFINEENTKNKTDKAYNGPFYKKLKKLYKQVLFPREKAFSIAYLDDEKELVELLNEIDKRTDKKSLFSIISLIKNANPEGIVVKGSDIHILAHMTTGDHNAFTEKMHEAALCTATKKEANNISKKVANTIYTIKEVEDITGADIFSAYIEKLLSANTEVSFALERVKSFGLLEGKKPVFGRTDTTKVVKEYLDALNAFRRNIILISKASDDADEADNLFYNDLQERMECFDSFVKVYNMVRNYLTRSPKDMAHETQFAFGMPLKLNSQWLNEEKFKKHMCSILKMDGKYYFATVSSDPAVKPLPLKMWDGEGEYVELFNQKTSQKAQFMYPKKIFKDTGAADFFEENKCATEYEVTTGLKKPYVISRRVYEIYRDELAKTSAVKKNLVTQEEFRENLNLLIKTYIEMAQLFVQWDRFNFDFEAPEKYKDLSVLYGYTDTCMFIPEWEKVDRAYIEDAIESGKLLVFLVTNRNMYTEGEKTSYARLFLQMMSDENFENGQIRLNSRPMMTFREACLPRKITHKAGSILVNKKTKSGEFIRGDLYMEIYNHLNGFVEKKYLSDEAYRLLNSGEISSRVADYDIIKDKRYTEDKFFVSFSYTKNAKLNPSENNTISYETEEQIKKEGTNVLAISRGTENLLYYMLFDKAGKVIEKRSLNVIDGVDYQAKLKALSDERNAGKSEDWKYDKKVKNYKTSYLNFAIAEIVKIAVRNNAVIVIEDINDKFKDKMSCIDNQVYKAFENKLEAKLLDFYDKKTTEGEAGSISNPIQLTQQFDYAIHPRQNGALFRISGAYVRSMDSKTGFINLFDTQDIKTIAHKREFLSKFNSITFNNNNIVFAFDYNNFKLKNDLVGKADWEVVAGKPQTVYDREHSCYKYIENPAREVIALAKAEFADVNAHSVNEYSNALVRDLYSLFYTTLTRNIVKKCSKVEESYYTSPVRAENDYLMPDENACINLKSKLDALIEVDDDAEWVSTWVKNTQALTLVG